MMKTSFQKSVQKGLFQRDYTSACKDTFLTYLSNPIENSQCHEAFEAKTVDVLNKHISKKLTKEIMNLLKKS